MHDFYKPYANIIIFNMYEKRPLCDDQTSFFLDYFTPPISFFITGLRIISTTPAITAYKASCL